MTRAVRLSILVLLLIPMYSQAQTPTIEYKIGMSRPWTHYFEVELTFKGLPSSPATVDFLLPIWRTGRYVVFDFAGGVQEFSAQNGSGANIPWAKTDKSTWRVEKGGANAVTIRY